MPSIHHHIKTLEKLSLITCSKDVLSLLERTLINVEPILKVDTQGHEILLWQNELTMDRLHCDQQASRLGTKELKKNASGFFEDYIAVGVPTKKL